MLEPSKYILDKISSIGDPQKSAWLENYVKHDIKSKGVGIPEIRQVLKLAEKRFYLTHMPIIRQVELMNDLMKQEYTEDKLAAILYLEINWKKENQKMILEVISDWFDQHWINDWNVCDWLCVKVLTPVLEETPGLVIPLLKKWNKNQNPWKARASLVPFAQAKSIGNHREVLEQFATELIKREERFCKTAVGWVMREYSKIDKNFVEDFLENNKEYTTKEVIQNALKYSGKFEN
jgi:3-methyladenine DNA glycosylase AlkD